MAPPASSQLPLFSLEVTGSGSRPMSQYTSPLAS